MVNTIQEYSNMESAVEIIKRLHEHRRWSIRQMLSVAKGLSQEQLNRTFAIGQRTVWRSLFHLYAAEYVWLGALEGNERPVVPGDDPGMLPGNQRLGSEVDTIEKLATVWEALQQRWHEFLNGFFEAHLNRPVKKIVTSSGPARVIQTPARDILMHVCMHAHYTMSQLNNMLRQLGVDPVPDIMLITLAREEAV